MVQNDILFLAYDKHLNVEFLKSWVLLQRCRGLLWLHQHHATGAGAVVDEVILFQVSGLVDLLKTSHLIEGGRQVEVVVSHRRLQELLIVEVFKHANLGQNPIATISIELIAALPYLQLFVQHPNAVVFQRV